MVLIPDPAVVILEDIASSRKASDVEIEITYWQNLGPY